MTQITRDAFRHIQPYSAPLYSDVLDLKFTAGGSELIQHKITEMDYLVHKPTTRFYNGYSAETRSGKPVLVWISDLLKYYPVDRECVRAEVDILGDVRILEREKLLPYPIPKDSEYIDPYPVKYINALVLRVRSVVKIFGVKKTTNRLTPYPI